MISLANQAFHPQLCSQIDLELKRQINSRCQLYTIYPLATKKFPFKFGCINIFPSLFFCFQICLLDHLPLYFTEKQDRTRCIKSCVDHMQMCEKSLFNMY